ncbi:malto-oligosyltrehalose trehalohydrolase [Phenylobacterium deserti]|uniref:Malto-oligosyltrehalose trehalohydrolase n=1 Tax=Phenylobacterium deserti TaxID=1914756 RepID=A0A328AH91_9CAUL|nr:malto-oligosyltrehalose trehalohydrolase [Phenylobacterium deserti]RAK52228.1 malto-oligosyltrehalose trehalohydrolase [Phenylobacterium deserti]
MSSSGSDWGATWLGDGRTRFRLWAPGQTRLSLEIEGRDALALETGADGWFETIVQASPGARYRYRLENGLAVPDPASRAQAGDVHGWSLVTDPTAYSWRQSEWLGRPWRETVVQEVHAGVLGGFAGVAARLPSLAELGVTAVQLMPVAAVSGQRNWGYDGVLPYAPAAAYGSPDELKALVDEAHRLGLMIFLDVVYNHFGPDGNYLPAYAPEFFDESRQTPWGAAIAFGREPVARFFIDNAIYWLSEFRLDGLRFDAVHAIADETFLDRMAAEVSSAVPDREVHLILENESNDAARLTRGYTAQWNDDFHNVLHVLLTDETQAYYQDFAEQPAEKLARCLAEGFIYQGEGSPNHDGAPRGTASGHLSPTAFVTFLQNHDQVGNRALGERLTALVAPERLQAAMGLLLLCPQIPLLFMGEEDGSQTPFLFFTDFHDELADAVREGRRKEFAKFPAFADPEARQKIPDPNAASTFESSRPEPGPDAESWRALVGSLLALRRDHIVPYLDEARSLGGVALGPKAVQAAWSLGDQRLTVALNLGDEAVTLKDPPQDAPVFDLGLAAEDDQLAPAAFIAWLEPQA